MRIALVVFDMAGTTVAEGGFVYRCLRDALGTYDVEVSEADLHSVKGTDKREALRVLIERSNRCDELLPQLDQVHRTFVERLIAAYRNDVTIGEVVGTTATFRRLRQHGIRVALNTGYSRDIAQMLIDRMGWEREGLIDASVTSDEVEGGRPHPFMIRQLMQQLGVADAGQVAKVGDAPADLLEGRNAGCGLVIGVTGGSSTREQLQVLPHDHLVESVADVPALLGL